MRDRVRHDRRPRHLVTHACLLVGALAMVGPFAWQILTSFKPFAELSQVPPTLLPQVWDFGNYASVLDSIPFVQMFSNTAVMTVGRTLGQLALCAMAGYGFARLEFRGKNVLFLLFLSVLMIPTQLFLIPQYEIMQRLGWLNTVQALVVPGVFSAFGTFLMRQVFAALPRELEEAARMDGANPWRTFWHVMLPLAKPGLLSLAILTIIWSWNDLLWPLVVNNEPDKMVLSAGLAQLQGEHSTDYTVLMAGSLLAILPLVMLFATLQRQFIQGVAFTGSKD